MLLPTAVGFLQSFLGDIIAVWGGPSGKSLHHFCPHYRFLDRRGVRIPLVIAFPGAPASSAVVMGLLASRHRDYYDCSGCHHPTVDPVNMTLVMAPVAGALFRQRGHCFRRLNKKRAAAASPRKISSPTEQRSRRVSRPHGPRCALIARKRQGTPAAGSARAIGHRGPPEQLSS